MNGRNKGLGRHSAWHGMMQCEMVWNEWSRNKRERAFSNVHSIAVNSRFLDAKIRNIRRVSAGWIPVRPDAGSGLLGDELGDLNES